MEKHEKPQKKNRHRFVVDQHVFPVASIARFLNNKKGVSFHDKLRDIVRVTNPHDVAFCARRAWSQWAETGYMKRIEDKFQCVANDIISGDILNINEDVKTIVNNFYALWYMRSRSRNLETQEIQANGLAGNSLTLDQEEDLELNGYAMLVRQGGKIPARQINAIQLHTKIYKYSNNNLSDTQWGIIHAQAGEFIVPDVPKYVIVPLTPEISLISPAPNGVISSSNVAEINRNVREASQEYFFARDFSK